MGILMLGFVKADFAKALVGKISNDNKATILGVALAGLMASRLDWGLLMKGDSSQMGVAVGAVVTAVLGYYTNKKDAKGEPS